MPRHVADRPLPVDHDEAKTGARRVRVNLAESPLGWLYNRHLVDDRQYAAGELLRRDYELAGLSSRVTMAWDAPPIGKQPRGANAEAGMTGRIDAHRRFSEAVRTAGSGLADVLWRVICAGERLPEVERAMGWPGRAGRLVLSLALDRVADYYRVP